MSTCQHCDQPARWDHAEHGFVHEATGTSTCPTVAGTTDLPATYDDVLYVEHAGDIDLATMSEGCHYDYRQQTWRDGHDHAHFVSNDDAAPLLFCGADRVTCHGGDDFYDDVQAQHDEIVAGLLDAGWTPEQVGI